MYRTSIHPAPSRHAKQLLLIITRHLPILKLLFAWYGCVSPSILTGGEGWEIAQKIHIYNGVAVKRELSGIVNLSTREARRI